MTRHLSKLTFSVLLTLSAVNIEAAAAAAEPSATQVYIMRGNGTVMTYPATGTIEELVCNMDLPAPAPLYRWGIYIVGLALAGGTLEFAQTIYTGFGTQDNPFSLSQIPIDPSVELF